MATARCASGVGWGGIGVVGRGAGRGARAEGGGGIESSRVRRQLVLSRN